MSGLATTRTNAKRSCKENEPTDSGSAAVGGSAAPTENAGNTNNALKSKTPLQAALVSQKLSFASLPKVSHPFLMPIAEKTLREFATYYYAKEKANGTKSNPNYVASSARKLNIVLSTESNEQESQAFKTLRDDLTARLEEFRIEITRDYVIKAADITVNAKKTKFHAAICKWIRLVAKTFIVQHDIRGYNEDIAIIDLLMMKRDDLLCPLGLNLKEFLLVYKDANKLQAIPSPTNDHNIQFVFDTVNGVPPINPQQQLLLRANGEEDDNDGNVGGDVNVEDVPDENMSDTNDESIAGGTEEIHRLTFNTIVRSVYDPIQAFYDQCKLNEGDKRIKAAIAPIRITETASRVATVLGNEKPAPKPVLRGLIDETTAKKTDNMERRIQSLEDKLKAAISKKVNGDGTKPKNTLRKGTPIAEKTTAPKTTTTPIKGRRGRDASNNDAESGIQKSKRKGRKVSFGGKKGATNTNSRK